MMTIQLFGQVELPALKYNRLKMRVQAKKTAGLNLVKCNLTSKRPSTYSLVLLRSSSTVKNLHSVRTFH